MNKIKKIIIQNFKGIENKTYCPEDKPFWMLGENGFGKTSFLEAMRFGLTGKMPKDMIRHGHKEGYVAIAFNDPDNTIIERRFFAGEKPNKVKMNAKMCTAKAAQKVICDIMNASEEKLDVFTSHDLFCELINGDLGKFLLSFISEPFSLSKLYDIVFFEEDEKDKIKSDKLLGKKFEISYIETVYQTLFAERAALKKQILLHQSTLEKYGVMEDEEIPEPFFKSEEALKTAENEYIIFKAAEKSGAAKKVAYERALTEYKRRLERKADIERQLSAAGDVEEITDEDIEKEENNLLNIRRLIANTESSIASNKVIAANNEKIYKALDSNACPISPCLTCKTDKSAVKSEVLESVNLANKTVEDCLNNLSILKEDEKKCVLAVNDIKKKAKKFKEVEFLEKRLLDIEIGSEPEKPDAFVADSSDISMFPIHKQEFVEYWDIINTREAITALTEKLNLCVRLLNKFAPKGEVNVAIMQHYCDLFDEEAETVSNLFGYEINFIPEDGVKLKIRPKAEKEVVDFSSLSRGERLITSIIIYAVLNSLMGTGIIVLDNFNDLDAIAAEKAKKIIDALYYELDIKTIFVAGCELETK